VQSVRDRGGIVIVVAHRPSALSACDTIGVIQNGKLAAFGPKNEILGQNGIAKVASPLPLKKAKGAA
jgi:ATP-binding cassette subfamily C protein